MFQNICREMAAHRMTIEQMSRELGICSKALSNKLSGKNEFKHREMLRIQAMIGGGMTLDELFEWAEE